jgi:hypothetical protein
MEPEDLPQLSPVRAHGIPTMAKVAITVGVLCVVAVVTWLILRSHNSHNSDTPDHHAKPIRKGPSSGPEGDYTGSLAIIVIGQIGFRFTFTPAKPDGGAGGMDFKVSIKGAPTQSTGINTYTTAAGVIQPILSESTTKLMATNHLKITSVDYTPATNSIKAVFTIKEDLLPGMSETVYLYAAVPES